MNHKDIAEEAIRILIPTISMLLREKAKRTDMHVVVMNPVKKPWECHFEEAILHEKALSDPSGWEHPYDELARAKAYQAWRHGKSNVHAHLIAPAVLADGDVAFYGSFEYEGVIVAASGVEGWFDVLVSGWIAVAIQQLAQDRYQRFKAERPTARYIS